MSKMTSMIPYQVNCENYDIERGDRKEVKISNIKQMLLNIRDNNPAILNVFIGLVFIMSSCLILYFKLYLRLYKIDLIV